MKNKSIAISVKNKVQEYFEKKVMTVGIKYRREMVNFHSFMYLYIFTAILAESISKLKNGFDEIWTTLS